MNRGNVEPRGRAAAMLLAAGLLSVSAIAHAAQGDCSQPVSSGANPTASDCLFVLRTAVGSETCSPACVCNANGDAGVSASDALFCLKKAVGEDVTLNCPCVTESTTTLFTTTTTLPICGDGTCNGEETCADCASECGACAECTGASDDATALDDQEEAFLVRINEYRIASFLEPLAPCTSLHRAAQAHSEDMRNEDFFDHVGSDGSSPWDRACGACFELGCGPQTSMAENIAAGNAAAEATFDQWKNSPGHNANMLATFSRIGIGRATGGGTYGSYWTTLFAGEGEPSCN
jgi:uncharacterized protein YkwD